MGRIAESDRMQMPGFPLALPPAQGALWDILCMAGQRVDYNHCVDNGWPTERRSRETIRALDSAARLAASRATS